MNINFKKYFYTKCSLFIFFIFFFSGFKILAAETSTPTLSHENMGSMQMPMNTEQSKSSTQEGAIYTCPMHPEEVSHKPGSCNICGMTLVEQKLNSGINSATEHGYQEGMNTAVMQHNNMKMEQQSRPPRYWDIEVESPAHQQHEQMSFQKPEVESRDDTLPSISGEADATSASKDSSHSIKHLDPTYICPMHPHIIQHEPGGNCPICGMNLVAKEIAAPASDNPQVFLPAAVIQNMGVRTEKVRHKTINRQIRTQGRVTADAERLLSIHSRTGGWVEVLHLITEGDRVERKDELVDFYSPWINQVQLDYISALEEFDLTSFDPEKKVEIGAKVDSLRNSLRLFNVMDMDIMRIRNSRKVQSTIQLLAPQGGIITRLNINEGSYVEPYESMFTIVDLSQVWVMVDIYEHQAPWVRKDNKVKITVPAIPSRSWEGVIDFIYPQVNTKTRTLRARIVVPNPDEALLLNMFVRVDITSNASNQATLSIPREAIIITGERKSVIKSMGEGHFQPVEVTTGKRGEGQVEILSGLQKGDEIVISGQFLIDSESSLQASFLRMSE